MSFCPGTVWSFSPGVTATTLLWVWSPIGAARPPGRAPDSDLPKHLLWLVARSTKTLAEMTLPKGKNICVSSASPNSWGR